MKTNTHNFSDNCNKIIEKVQDRFLTAYKKKRLIVAVLESVRSFDDVSKFGLNRVYFDRAFGSGKKYQNFVERLINCGSFLTFRHYPKQDETKLHDANFCRIDKLCVPCAIRRAYKQQNKFLDILSSYPQFLKKNWYYIVIPVKHSIDESIEVVYNRLDRVRKSILQAMRDKRKNRKAGFWGQFDGGMGSIEVTKTKNGWNVHLNLLVCSDRDIPLIEKHTKDKFGREKINFINPDLMVHLQRVGEGSYIHNISKLDFSSSDEIKSNLVEVLKYSLKFSSLSQMELLQVYSVFYRKRLFFTFGNLRGLKLEDVELSGDDVVDDEFVELIFRRVDGSYVPFVSHSQPEEYVFEDL